MYLIWQMAEVATKKGNGRWKCFCGERRDDQYSMEEHLEDVHGMKELKYDVIEN